MLGLHSTRINFKHQGAHPRLRRAQSRPERGPSKIRGAKTSSSDFLRGTHSTRGPFHGLFYPHHQSSGWATACSSQLLELFGPRTIELDHSNIIDLVYLVFQKAFNSIPHSRLLAKL